MSASSAIIVTLFFGGFQIPWLDTQSLQNNITYIIYAILAILPISVFFLNKWMKKNYIWKNKNDLRFKEGKILIRAFWSITILIMSILYFYLFLGLGENETNIITAVIQISTFLIKFFMMNFVFIWIRWTLLRFRYDQLQMLGWKVLLPLSLLNIIVTATFIVVKGA